MSSRISVKCGGNGARPFQTAALGGFAAAIAALLSAGCSDTPHTSNVDSAFLTSPLSALTDDDKETNLLPLTLGNNWQMRSVTRGRRYLDSITVAGQVKVEGVPCFLLSMTRDGQPWRSEAYVPDPDAVLLAAAQDESSPMMTFSPPITLVRSRFVEGQSWIWQGTLRLKNVVYAAQAFSRVSGREPITTSAGQFKAYRIDTIIVLNEEGQEIRFPSVRWLAPDVGFVRRGFADKRQPAFSELQQFNVH